MSNTLCGCVTSAVTTRRKHAVARRLGSALVLALLGLTLAGCMTSPRIDRSQVDADVVLAPGGDQMTVDVPTAGPDGRPFRPTIDLDSSFATDGSRRYSIRAVRDEALARTGYKATRWRIKLVDPGSDTGLAMFWPYGAWHLHLAFVSAAPTREPMDIRFGLSAQIYSPLIQGFPN